MGTLLQSWLVTFKIIALWRISNPWITTPERSSSFCHLSSTHGLLLFSLLCSPSNILTTWLIIALILPTATARKWGRARERVGAHPNKPFYPCKCFLYCLSVCLQAFSSTGSVKLLNNRSSEAEGRLWHLSPITAEPPLPCHRPDQPVPLIYGPLSAVTSVKRVQCCWPSHNYRGFPTWARSWSVPPPPLCC